MFLFLPLVSSAKYAILIAGSRSWENHRHQADIFYMYKLLKERGFDDNHISMWAYNDIVNNSLNPYKGQIFHYLTNENIYPGDDKIDYKGKEVTGNNFLKFLKEINTTENDDIFFYYNDHGSPNMLVMPDDRGITTYSITNTIQVMKRLKKFHRMLFVVEACFSGCLKDSIFPSEVAVITAARCVESSYSSILNRWLGDIRSSNEFSAYLFQEIESNPHHSILTLFEAIKEKMVKSTPTIIGDMKNTLISEFIGVGPKKSLRRSAFSELEEKEEITRAVLNAPPHIRQEYNKHLNKQKELTKKLLKSIFTIVKKVAGEKSDYFMTKQIDDNVSKCHEPVLEFFLSKFGELNPDDGALFTPLKTLCSQYDSDTIINAINSTI